MTPRKTPTWRIWIPDFDQRRRPCISGGSYSATGKPTSDSYDHITFFTSIIVLILCHEIWPWRTPIVAMCSGSVGATYGVLECKFTTSDEPLCTERTHTKTRSLDATCLRIEDGAAPLSQPIIHHCTRASHQIRLAASRLDWRPPAAPVSTALLSTSTHLDDLSISQIMPCNCAETRGMAIKWQICVLERARFNAPAH